MPEALAGACATLHGFDLHYVDAGQGAPVVFIHGLLGSHRDWSDLLGDLSTQHRVLAPDLFGHGSSAKPMGDYSLGAHAATLRDLLDHLDVPAVTLVGHSLGGGIALQFAYLFPDRVQRLVLVSSGGLGRELSLLLRAATLPGAEWVLPVLASRWIRDRGEALGRGLSRAGLRAGPDATQMWERFMSLGDPESRRAFLATSRAVIDPGGQTVTAQHRLSEIANVPTLLVWGTHDRLIPSWHAVAAQEVMPNSRVEVFEQAGHFTHLDEPDRFVGVLREFIADNPH
ncbi:MAG: alpha/beta fold hydrolase [Actinomycetes bacterium]